MRTVNTPLKQIEELGEGKKPVPPLMKVYNRLEDLKDIALRVGLDRYKQGLKRPGPEVMEARKWVLKELEGVDAFWDGIPEDGYLDSNTQFGKMYIEPFPFRCVVVYDDCDDYVFIKDEEFMSFVAANRDPDTTAKRKLRMSFRGLALTQASLYFHHEQDIAKSIGSGDNRRTVRVPFVFNHGRISVKRSKSSEWSAGFDVRLTLYDGKGHYGSHSWENECLTLQGPQFGVVCKLDRTPKLDRLLEKNATEFRDGYEEFSAKLKEYRNDLRKRRTDDAAILSFDFWAEVYQNPDESRENLEALLQEEANPVVAQYHGQVHAAN